MKNDKPGCVFITIIMIIRESTHLLIFSFFLFLVLEEEEVVDVEREAEAAKKRDKGDERKFWEINK